ncbi:MAG: 50S ribosomal protein L33 [bacterium]
MREQVIIACTECKQRNYSTMKNKRLHPDRMEIKKYCRWCNKHTLHRETR